VSTGGLATGITQTTRNFGSSFGLAALGTLLVTVERSHLASRLEKLGLPTASAQATAARLASSRGGGGAPAGVPPALARQVFRAAQVSLGEGMRGALRHGRRHAHWAAIVAARGLRRGLHAAADADPGGPAAAAGVTGVPAAAPSPR
jgi:hypothetical protein